jgi:hypothetical protein
MNIHNLSNVKYLCKAIGARLKLRSEPSGLAYILTLPVQLVNNSVESHLDVESQKTLLVPY